MKACDFKKLQASTDKNYIARLFRNNFVTMASIGWTHPDSALEVLKCFVPRRKEFRDLSLPKGGLPVVKTIEEHQLFGLLAPVNQCQGDAEAPEGSAEGSQESSDWEKQGSDHACHDGCGGRWYIGGEPCQSPAETNGLL